MRRVPGDGIEFVVAHHGQRSARFHHGADQFHRAPLRWPAVDEVADENGRSLAVAPGAVRGRVIHFSQQRFQRFGVAVEIADDVVVHELASVDRAG